MRHLSIESGSFSGIGLGWPKLIQNARAIDEINPDKAPNQNNDFKVMIIQL